ncbi:hypothetical protein HPP92_014109 [Vanilla planifolia]|uniref:Uncharacterized protein n=1 Tax=Vanilla planifolia TaxID=51239 RepID=A0A835QTS7_VANPL|nr:hypothetical protein HPP92_014109 [Vanilla planifolia]
MESLRRKRSAVVENDGVIRLKMVVSKQELQLLLSSTTVYGGRGMAAVEQLLMSLRRRSIKWKENSRTASRPWRPTLQSIPEEKEFFFN